MTEERKKSGWKVSFWNDWDSVWPWSRVNWRNFTIINLHLEYDAYLGFPRFEIQAGILGLNIVICWQGEGELRDEIREAIEEIERKEKG